MGKLGIPREIYEQMSYQQQKNIIAKEGLISKLIPTLDRSK